MDWMGQVELVMVGRMGRMGRMELNGAENVRGWWAVVVGSSTPPRTRSCGRATGTRPVSSGHS